MTCEPTHTVSKETMVPELMFSSEHMPQLLIIVLKVQMAITLRFQLITQRYK